MPLCFFCPQCSSCNFRWSGLSKFDESKESQNIRAWIILLVHLAYFKHDTILHIPKILIWHRSADTIYIYIAKDTEHGTVCAVTLTGHLRMRHSVQLHAGHPLLEHLAVTQLAPWLQMSWEQMKSVTSNMPLVESGSSQQWSHGSKLPSPHLKDCFFSRESLQGSVTC